MTVLWAISPAVSLLDTLPRSLHSAAGARPQKYLECKGRAQEKTGRSGRDDSVTIVTAIKNQSENLKRTMHQRACTPSFQVIFFPSS
jgi:hypothetical protein